MSETTPSRLAEALIVGLAAAALYLVRGQPVLLRSAYPDLAGNFAL
jgi:hypothetical protein